MMKTMYQARGFTLVETLVAIAVLMIAITGPFYSIQQALAASYSARDQLIASSLAQEGVEYMYYLRDNAYLSNSADPSSAWTNSFVSALSSSGCLNANGCAIDAKNNTRYACTNATCTNVGPLKLDAATGLYGYGGSAAATRFTRIVTVTQVDANQVRITVKVTWESSHRNYVITTTENIYNWL